jgi:hypothetical protein
MALSESPVPRQPMPGDQRPQRFFAICRSLPVPRHSAWWRKSGKEQIFLVNCRAVNRGVAEMTINVMMVINAAASMSVNLDCERFITVTTSIG